MVSDLIIDVGMHEGQDTAYYLKQGYRVIGIDADIVSIQAAKKRFKKYITTKQFMPLHCAIADTDNDSVIFNISHQSIWNSLKVEVSDRHSLFKEAVSVQTRTLSSIFQQFGVPYYCKIDIEGYDNICLTTLSIFQELPTYISVETECIGEAETYSLEDALQTLVSLHHLGYQKFKLVDQASLQVLVYNHKFYSRNPSLFNKITQKIKNIPRRAPFYNLFNNSFALGASGPFGEKLAGKWYDYDTARKTLERHRQDYFGQSDSLNYGFWCDWHATF